LIDEGLIKRKWSLREPRVPGYFQKTVYSTGYHNQQNEKRIHKENKAKRAQKMSIEDKLRYSKQPEYMQQQIEKAKLRHQLAVDAYNFKSIDLDDDTPNVHASRGIPLVLVDTVGVETATSVNTNTTSVPGTNTTIPTPDQPLETLKENEKKEKTES
jgi:hypothetical protein